jgi:hypothetical protein
VGARLMAGLLVDTDACIDHRSGRAQLPGRRLRVGLSVITRRSCARVQVPEPKAGKHRLHLDLYPTGRGNALPMQQRIEIVEAMVAELVDLGGEGAAPGLLRRHARSGRQRILRRLNCPTRLHLALSELQATLDAAGKHARMVTVTACDA